ncbi:MAG: hypothetical protein J6J24_03750 [Clostridia bacterium]|nr:hypothetical protein [Clostridia bacterium]
MIFYKNKKSHKKTSEKNLIFSIFANGIVSDKADLSAKPNECKNCFNLSIVDGVLKTGLGFSDIEVPSSEQDYEATHSVNFASKIDKICGIWLDRWYNPDINKFVYQLLMTDSANKIWGLPLIDEYNMIWLKTNKMTSEPTFQCAFRLNDEDTALFFSNGGMIRLSQNSEALYENVPAMISGVVHYDKFFGITNEDRNVLVYTSNLDLTSWQESESSVIEFLDNRGAFCKLVAFNDYVYLFRENGITKISIYTAKNDFSFTHLYCSTSKIYENSVCVCGDKVLFMTRDGLYAFNGNSVDKVAEEYDKLFQNLDNKNCSSACHKGKYYLATKCNFSDNLSVGCESSGEYVNNVLFEIDIDDFSLNFYRGVDIKGLLSIDNPILCKLCACFNNLHKQRIGQLEFNGKTFEDSNLKVWESFVTDLGHRAKRKKIKEIVLNTLYDCEVQISSDEETKTYIFLGSSKEQRLSVSVYGKNFQFSFKTGLADCEISKPMIVFDVVK